MNAKKILAEERMDKPGKHSTNSLMWLPQYGSIFMLPCTTEEV